MLNDFFVKHGLPKREIWELQSVVPNVVVGTGWEIELSFKNGEVAK